MIPKATPLDWADDILDAKVLKQVRDIVRWTKHNSGPLLFDGPGARFAAALVEAACGRKVRVVDASRHTNDRAANQRIAYLLQRIEDLPGVVILVTNLQSRLDEAYARRFQSVVLFRAPAWSPAKRVRRSAPSKPPRRPSRGRSKPPSHGRSKT